jgi:hypothetical protein
MKWKAWNTNILWIWDEGWQESKGRVAQEISFVMWLQTLTSVGVRDFGMRCDTVAHREVRIHWNRFSPNSCS